MGSSTWGGNANRATCSITRFAVHRQMFTRHDLLYLVTGFSVGIPPPSASPPSQPVKHIFISLIFQFMCMLYAFSLSSFDHVGVNKCRMFFVSLFLCYAFMCFSFLGSFLCSSFIFFS